MDHFHYVDAEAYCEDVSLNKIADEVGTPTFVYSKATLVRHCQKFQDAFAKHKDFLACFAVKASSNLSVLKIIAANQFGADTVSIGEIERCRLAGIAGEKIIYSGVGKRDDEIVGGLEANIYTFNVESFEELTRIDEIAFSRGKTAAISVRLNPNIDAKTNPKITTGLYTSKFGIPETDLDEIIRVVSQSKSLQLKGIGCHIGSQITRLDPLREAAQRMRGLVEKVRSAGVELEFLNMGGGLGIRYADENPPSLEEYAETLIKEISPLGIRLLVEPGRVIAGNAGILLAEVIGRKQTPSRHFMIVDAAMNDLIRPSMYDSFHEVCPVNHHETDETVLTDVVGPICESGDFLAKDRNLPILNRKERIYVRACGAYASTMSSNYNSRPRAAEVLVDGDKAFVIRRRESLTDLWRHEVEIDIL